MDAKKYTEANSLAERSQPEPESSVDFDNDDEDKLVIVEDPNEAQELMTAHSSDTATVSSTPETTVSLTPEVKKNFRGPKKKFLEAFCRSESIASEGDSTAESSRPPDKSGQAEVGSSSIDREDSNSTPVPHSIQSESKACDSTKGDEDSNDGKRNGVPMFNLRSCIDLIIDSRLIRERLNTSDDILNEQYNIKVSLSRVNEGKTVRELAQSNKECKTLRNVLHQSLSDNKDWENALTVSRRDSQSCISSTAAKVCVEPSISVLSPEDQSEPKQVPPASVPLTDYSPAEEYKSRHDGPNPLHHIAALASVLPQEPIVIADDDKIVTARPQPHSLIPAATTAYPEVQTEKTMHPVSGKKAMPPLIDTRRSSPTVIDVDSYPSPPLSQGLKSSPWVGHTAAATRRSEHPDFAEKKGHLSSNISRPVQIHEDPYRSMSSNHPSSYRSQITEMVHRTIDAAWGNYPSASSKFEPAGRLESKGQSHTAPTLPPPDQYPHTSSSSNPNSARVHQRGPSPRVVETPGQREVSWSANRAHLYPSSGGQLLAHNRSVSSGQLSPQMPHSGGTSWGTSHTVGSHPAVHRPAASQGSQSSYSPYPPHHHHPSGSIRQSAEHPTVVHGEPHKHVPSPQYSKSYAQPSNTQADPRDLAHMDYSAYTPKVIQGPGPSSALNDSQRDIVRRSDYGYHDTAYLSPRSQGHHGPKGPPPRLLYVPNAAAAVPQPQENIMPVKVHALASETQHSHNVHTRQIVSSHTEAQWSKPYQPKQHTPVELSKPIQHLATVSSAPAPLDLTVRAKPYLPSLPVQGMRESESHFKKPPREEAPLDLTVRRPAEPSHEQIVPHVSPRQQEMYSSSIDHRFQTEHSAVEQFSPGQRQGALNRSPNPTSMMPPAAQQHGFTPVMPPHRSRMSTSPHTQSSPVLGSSTSPQGGTPQIRSLVDSISELRTASLGYERPSISRGVIDPDIEKQQTQALNQQQQQFQGINRGQPKMSTTAQLLGNHPPHDILYLKCNVCTSTYGSLHSFRKHFWKVHGYGPTNEHVTVRSISATRGSATKTEKAMDEIEKPVQAELVQSQLQSSASESFSSRLSSPDNPGQAYDMVHMQVQRRCTLGEMNHKMAPLSETNTLESTATGKAGSPTQKSDSMQSTMRCLQCGQDFPTRDWGVFRRHVRAHEQPMLRCTVCRQAFSSTRELHEHNRTYHQDQMWICRICGVGFVNPGDLGKHMKLIHPSDTGNEEEYKCQLCPLVFDDMQLLLSHLNDHKDQPELVSQYAELLVPGSNVVRASPDSTNDVDSKPPKDGIKQEEETTEGQPDTEPGSKSLTESETKASIMKGSISSCTTSDPSGKQSTVLKMPKKALYDFIKDRVEIEARRQLGGLSQEEFDSKNVEQPLKSSSPIPSSTKIETNVRPSNQEKIQVVLDEQKLDEASAVSKPFEICVSDGHDPISTSDKGAGKRPYTTVRDTLHMLVERAIIHDYKLAGEDKNDDVSSTKGTSVEQVSTAASVRSSDDCSSVPLNSFSSDFPNDTLTAVESNKLVISEAGKQASDQTGNQAAHEQAAGVISKEAEVDMDEQKSHPPSASSDQIQEGTPQTQQRTSAEEHQDEKELVDKSNCSQTTNEDKKEANSCGSLITDSKMSEPSAADESKSSHGDDPTVSNGQRQKRVHPPELAENCESVDPDLSVSPCKKSKV